MSRAAPPNWPAPDLAARLRAKRARRLADEAAQPLASYRAAELAECSATSTVSIRAITSPAHHFVHKTPNSWTPRHLAIHRELGWSVPQ
jgi:putative two-component system hydrogenase maturation factor HypX/HoxX